MISVIIPSRKRCPMTPPPRTVRSMTIWPSVGDMPRHISCFWSRRASPVSQSAERWGEKTTCGIWPAWMGSGAISTPPATGAGRTTASTASEWRQRLWCAMNGIGNGPTSSQRLCTRNETVFQHDSESPEKKRKMPRILLFFEAEYAAFLPVYRAVFIEGIKTAHGLHTAPLLGFQRIWLRMS